VDEVTAGNIAGIVGIPEAFSGETVCDPESIMMPFEEIKHIFEPVVTKSIEPKDAMELPKLINFLKQISREDTTLKVKINQETGEYIVSGLGELHLEAKVERKLKALGIDVVMSQPIVVYRETVLEKSPEIEGKSPNKHNKFSIYIEPISDEIFQAMVEGTVPSDLEVKGKNKELIEKLVKLGMDRDEAKNVILIHEKNIFLDSTKGVQYLNEVMELLKEAFDNVMDEGPLCKEPSTKVKVILTDAELHEDPVHRGPGQLIPAFRHTIIDGMMHASPTLLEPKQVIRVDVPEELIGVVTRELENRRGQILDMINERGQSQVKAKVPVSEIFGLDATLKSATSGRGFYSVIEVTFEKLPRDLQIKTINGVRKRKGMEVQEEA
jgi:elongation factor 2